MRIAFLLVFTSLLLSRFTLLETSARFVWDESDDLVRMQQIWEQKRITLVGPISESNVNIYGSLSYYMLMPFTVAFGFDPLVPVIGTAFWNLAIILILAFILCRYFTWSWPMVILFLTPLFPLLQSGRWAWNPHFVPFWQTISLFFIIFAYKKPKWYWWIPAGLAQGLAIHNHWYALFALLGFSLTLCLLSLKEREYRRLIYFGLGVFLAILPFILFDLKNPPGLFLTRFLYFGPFAPRTNPLNLMNVLDRLPFFFFSFLNYFIQKTTLTTLIIIPFLAYLIYVFAKTKNSFRKLLLIPVGTQLLGIALAGPHIFGHYLLPGVVFFLLFLTIPDRPYKFSKYQLTVLVLLWLLSLKPAINEITQDTWMTNIHRTRKITEIIAQNIQGQRCNLFVAASPDPNTVGKRYRDLLTVKHVSIMGKEEYRNYECLFVISISDLKTIQKDPAYELDLIRNKNPTEEWKAEIAPWVVYKFISR